MRLLALSILTFGLSNVWAGVSSTIYSGGKVYYYDGAISTTAMIMPYKWAYPEWTVVKGSETYTLKEFVISGKFCDIFGHDWTEVLADTSGPITIWYDSHTRFSCRRCKAKKIIRTDTREEISR